MQTSENVPPPAQSQVTITTVGPNGKTLTIATPPVPPQPEQPAQPAQAAQPALAPVAVISPRPPWVTAKLASLGIIGTVFVLLPISIAMAIRMIRRPMRHQETLNPGVDERLSRLEQSIDAIAIEMERVSEGQRYVTRLLASDRVAS